MKTNLWYCFVLPLLVLVIYGCSGQAARDQVKITTPPVPAGATPIEQLIHAAKYGDVNSIKSLLAKDPGLAKAANNTGETALHFAARFGQVQAVKALLDAGADVNAKTADGQTPYDYASQGASPQEVLDLVQPK